MKISTDWLRDFIDLKPPFPSHAEALTEAGLEVESVSKSPSGDTVFQVEVTSNRPDWLSQYGVARELSAIHGLALAKPLVADEKKFSRTPPTGWKIICRDGEACPYYTGILIEGITERKIPEFIQKRLESCGVRSIDLIVDITNYVMLELGQPLHAFDADSLAGDQIVIRWAKKDEKLEMLSGGTLELTEKDLVIAGPDKALALAGVMGGKETEVTARTRNVFLEVAHFLPRAVRESSFRHQLSTDSSYRFERRVDPCLVDLARQRALQLIQEHAKPRHISGILRYGAQPNSTLATLHISEDYINGMLGCEIKTNQVGSILNRLGLDVKNVSAKSWKVTVPSFRPDLLRPIDLVEEVARIYGYNKIPEKLPSCQPGNITVHPARKIQAIVREAAVAAGFRETVTFSIMGSQGFEDEELKKMVHLRNPLQAGLEWMRPSLLPGLLRSVQNNLRHGMKNIRLFEIATTYHQNGKDIRECKKLGAVMSGSLNSQSWLDDEREVKHADLSGVIQFIFLKLGLKVADRSAVAFSGLQIGTAEKIILDGRVIAVAGQVSEPWLKLWDVKQPVYYCELDLEELRACAGGNRIYVELPKYPSVSRDLSLTVPENTLCGQVEKDIRDAGGELVFEVILFDLFIGGRVATGFKNISYHIVYLSSEKTLTSEEVDHLHSQIADVLVRKYQAQFQSKS